MRKRVPIGIKTKGLATSLSIARMSARARNPPHSQGERYTQRLKIARPRQTNGKKIKSTGFTINA
jgi:hypothetical protein